jgi:YD repeat-containing protein
MIRLPLALLTLAMLTGTASAQQRTFYDASGRVVARTSTDSSGTVTTRDSSGRVLKRESNSNGTITVYDPSGRVIGTRR